MGHRPRQNWPIELTCIEGTCKNKKHKGTLRCNKCHQAQKGGPRCSIKGCMRPVLARGWCQPHYYRWHRTGNVQEVVRLQVHREYGTGNLVSEGYLQLYRPDHPYATRKGYVLQHRLVMEEVLGRYLHEDETVHHRNGNKLDNVPSNLELWTSRHPKGQRVQDLVAYAHEIIATYGAEQALLTPKRKLRRRVSSG